MKINSSSKKVRITNSAVSCIKPFGFLTGHKYTDDNGTRHEIITYHSLRDQVIQLWLHESCFKIIE